jgi:hypothetical protein
MAGPRAKADREEPEPEVRSGDATRAAVQALIYMPDCRAAGPHRPAGY